jgi:S-adenosylmethionine decarboxylase proenzyme
LEGTHIIVDLHECKHIEKLLDLNDFEDFFKKKIIEQNLTIIDIALKSFGENAGYTGCIVLGESHLIVHTWPEFNKVQGDIFVCNVSKDNSKTCENLANEMIKYFGSLKFTLQRLKRE